MNPASRWVPRLLLFLAALTLSAPALAQTGVVLTGPTPVRQWRNASVVAFPALAGTVVEIIERDHDWCWVVLPPDTFGTRRVGWLPVSVLQISGTPPPAVLPSGIVPVPETSPDQGAAAEDDDAEVAVGADHVGDGRRDSSG